MNQTEQPRKYFDLHLTGLGYLSRVREVTSAGQGRARARPFLACSIAAFHGDPAVQNGIVYLNLDLIVSGEKAKDAVLSVMNDANDRDVKVLVGFRAGDHYISTYEIMQGDRAGQMGTVLKGRLLKVFWIKVDGVVIYQDERQDERHEDQADDPSEDLADDPDDVGLPDGHRQLDAPATGDAAFDDPVAEVETPDASASHAASRDVKQVDRSDRRQDDLRDHRLAGNPAGDRRGNSFLRRRKEEIARRGTEMSPERAQNFQVILARDILSAQGQAQREIKADAEIENECYRDAEAGHDQSATANDCRAAGSNTERNGSGGKRNV